MESLNQSAEQTLLFSEQVARLLASVKVQYTEANALMTDEDVSELEYHVNQQIKGYDKLEIYGGLKIVSATVKNINGTDLEFKVGVVEDQRLYKADGIDLSVEQYIGWHNANDLYVCGDQLRIRCNQNPKNDYIVSLEKSPGVEATEARERLKFMYIDETD